MKISRTGARDTWVYYGENTSIRYADVHILKILKRTAYQQTTAYLVRMLCCDDIKEMTHRAILSRLRQRKSVLKKNPDSPHHCRKCCNRSTNFKRKGFHRDGTSIQKPEDEFVAPTWPVPPGLIGKDPGIWEDHSSR